ncbi:MAG: hypothetical protein [Bacteriophage sp.]|nr:MAG: hypothetical protein [Bacteriophage sp.]
MKVFTYKVGGRQAGRIVAKNIQIASQNLCKVLPPNSNVNISELKNQLRALKEHYTWVLSKEKGIYSRGLWVFIDKEVNDISFYSYLDNTETVARYEYDIDEPIWVKTCLTKTWLDEACEKVL